MLPTYKTQLLNTFWLRCVNEALDALSKMIRKNVKLTNSSLKIELINNMPRLMNPQEIDTTLVYTILSGQLNCVIIITSPLKYFLRLIDILLNKKIDYYEALNEENKSSVLELGNIINGYFISFLNSLFNTRFKYEPPELSVNPYRAIEDFNFGDIYKKKTYVLLLNSDFKVEMENIEGKIFLLTEENNTDAILDMISKKVVLKLNSTSL